MAVAGEGQGGQLKMGKATLAVAGVGGGALAPFELDRVEEAVDGINLEFEGYLVGRRAGRGQKIILVENPVVGLVKRGVFGLAGKTETVIHAAGAGVEGEGERFAGDIVAGRAGGGGNRKICARGQGVAAVVA